MRWGRVLVGVLGLHLVVSVAHGSVHGLAPVPQPPWQQALVLTTVFVGPIAGVALVRRGHPLGVGLFTVSMAAGLLLGGILHFLVENPDHIHRVPANQWRPFFEASALGVFLTGTLGTLTGIWAWHRRSTP